MKMDEARGGETYPFYLKKKILLYFIFGTFFSCSTDLTGAVYDNRKRTSARLRRPAQGRTAWTLSLYLDPPAPSLIE